MFGEYLCLLTGLSPSHGPRDLISRSNIESTAQELAVQIASSESGVGCAKELQNILSEAFRQTLEDPERAWRPTGMHDPDFFDVSLVIGPQDVSSSRIDVRRACLYNSTSKCWNGALIKGEREWNHVPLRSWYGTGASHPFFVWERPFLYLKEWVDLPGPEDGEKSFEERFYELVDSTRNGAGKGFYVSYQPQVICLSAKRPDFQDSGVMRGVSYGGIEKAFGCDNQSSCRSGCRNTVTALAEGKRGMELGRAFAEDCGAWMCVRPDIWPTKPNAEEFVSSKAENLCMTDCKPGSYTYFHRLPIELLLKILLDVPLNDLLSLSAASRSLQQLVFTCISDILRHQIHSKCTASLRWILPVPTVEGEVPRACRAVSTWLPVEQSPPSARGLEIFEDPSIPWFKFVKACLKSNSMRNRRRMWKICKQYEGIWERFLVDRAVAV